MEADDEPAAPPPDPQQTATLEALRAPAPKPAGGWGTFFVTLAAFLLLAGAPAPPLIVFVLVGVLVVHELGHLAAMRLFGYADVRLFFIPFFGAAVRGRPPAGVAPWKQVYAAAMALGARAALPLVAARQDTLDTEAHVAGLTLRHPHSFRVDGTRSSIVIHRANEQVHVAVRRLAPGDTAETALFADAGLKLLERFPPPRGRAGRAGRSRCAGLEGPGALWDGTSNGVRVRVHACTVVHDGLLYVVASVEPAALSHLAEDIAASAHF